MKKSTNEKLLREAIRNEIEKVMIEEGLFSFLDNWLESLESVIDGEISKLKTDAAVSAVKKDKKLYAKIKKMVGNDERKIKEYVKKLQKDLGRKR